MAEQAIITSKLIKERIRRDKLQVLEEWHREESTGSREEQLEREQNQQEPSITDSDKDPIEELEDYLNSDPVLPRAITEPEIIINLDSEISQVLQDIDGEDEISLSILDNSVPFQDLEGDTEGYP